MKILIADKFESQGLDALRALGLDVTYQPELKEATLAEALAGTMADILVVRSTKVTDAILEAGQLSLVVRAGAGYDTIDVRSASRRGIYVSNCPGKNAVAVAELTFGLILALDRRIPDNVAELRAGTVEQEGVLEGAGAARPDARHPGVRQHRPGGGAPRAGVRHEPGHLERDRRPARPRRAARRPPADGAPAALLRGHGGVDGDGLRLPEGGRGELRHPERAPRAQREDPRPRRCRPCSIACSPARAS